MAFPKLLQKLFQNNGAGDKLNQDIIPDIPYSKITDAPSIDSALSSTSENPVQNKVINSALNSVSEKADNSGYQVGDIKLYAGSNVPNGWFRCDGSTIADMATNYPKLYTVLGTNVLPNYTGRYPVGASTGINQTVNAGLPNITARTNTFDGRGCFSDIQGAFSGGASSTWVFRAESWGSNIFYQLLFDASRSSAIYGSSTTVTPPSIKVTFLIKHD